MNVYVDGGGWTGEDCCLCVLFENRKPIIEILHEERTSNEMEFRAMIKALELCDNNAHIFSDSKIVVGHLIWGWESSSGKLKPLIDHAKNILRHKHCSIIWVPREKNKAGIILESRLKKIKNYKNSSLPIKRRDHVFRKK